jgi:hypothetical protein
MDGRTKAILLVNIIVILIGMILVLAGSIQIQWNLREVSDLGISLMASGIVTLFYFAYPKSNVEEKYRQLAAKGLTETYSARDLKDEYLTLLKRAKRNVDVLGLALNKFREDNGEIIKEKCLEGVSVRFLVMDPDSEIFKLRSKEEEDLMGETIKAPHEKLQKYVRETNDLIAAKGKGAKIQTKYYRSTPATMIFRIDDAMFVGPYLHKRISRNTCTFRLEPGELFSQYEEHFEKLWNDTDATRVL